VFEPLENEKDGSKLERMPKGEAITAILAPGEGIDVRLSKHACKLSARNDGIQFTDQAGRTYTTGKGRNIVGRDAVSNIIMEPTLQDISWLHLVIENFGDNTL